jgi:hypothetical protein
MELGPDQGQFRFFLRKLFLKVRLNRYITDNGLYELFSHK